MTVRVVTYNLLIPILAEEPGYYMKCRPEYLRTDYRWKLIRVQLEQEIRSHKNTIICLQEGVSTDPWQIAMSTENMLICLGVLIDGRPLLIGTYHMPCLYKAPDVMVIQVSAAKDLLFQIAAGHPFVFAGDFNLQPHDKSYRALTGRGYGRDAKLPITGDHAITYRFNTAQALRSAYREKKGTEPNYTNFCSTRKSPNFRATLDYIFFHGNLIVDDVLGLPHHPTGKFYPDKTHPSDHLMLAASIRFL